MSENNLVLHNEILEMVKSQMKKRGRKPKGENDKKVWDDVQYKRDYFNDYYKNVLKNKPIEMVECECGKPYNRLHKSQHTHGKHHTLYMDIKGKLVQSETGGVNPEKNVEKNV